MHRIACCVQRCGRAGLLLSGTVSVAMAATSDQDAGFGCWSCIAVSSEEASRYAKQADVVGGLGGRAWGDVGVHP